MTIHASAAYIAVQPEDKAAIQALEASLKKISLRPSTPGMWMPVLLPFYRQAEWLIALEHISMPDDHP